MAVTVKGTPASAAGTSVAIPTHAVGDLIVVFTYRDGSTTVPSKPSASGTVPAWVDISSGAGANTCSARAAYFVATATNHTTGTWTNATGIAVIVITGHNPSTPIGGAGQSGSTSSTSAVGPTVTLQDATGASMLLYFVGHNTVTAWSTAPSGFTRQTSVATEVALNTKNSTTTAGTMTQSCTTSGSAGYRGITVEIKVAPPLTRTAADSITFSDSASRSAESLARTTGDSITFSDTTNGTVGRPRAASDSITFSDSAGGQQGTSRAAIDSITFSDSASITKRSFVRPLGDTITFSDSTTRVSTRARATSDAFSVSDATTSGVGRTRAVGDSWSISETTSRSSSRIRPAGDSFTVSDAATRAALSRVRLVGDSITFSDASTRSPLTRTRLTADSWTVFDSEGRSPLTQSRTSSDSWSVNDDSTSALTVTRAVDDSWSMSDSTSSVGALWRVLEDTITFEDSTNAPLNWTSTPSDSWSVSDTTASEVHLIPQFNPARVRLEDTALANVVLADSAVEITLTHSVTARVDLKDRAMTNLKIGATK